VLVAFQALAAGPSELPDWILASTDARAVAGQPFEILLVSLSGAPLSFKYRLFDRWVGFGQDRPWLSGLYFGYTQNSLWDLSAQSKPFRDTSYRPSLF
jgi:hypothetical protein